MPAAASGSPSTVVLVVEDEPEIATQIARRLEAEGWRPHTAGDGLAGVRAAETLQPDLIVMDVMLPGVDGLEACRRIQALHAGAGTTAPPILMLTARDDETDLIIGLGVGADDYMTKPFSMRELLARLKVLLRRVDRARHAPVSDSGALPLTLGDLVIDRAARRVSRDGKEAHLTPTEFDLLVCLAQSPKTVLSRERLLAQVWDWADASGTRTVDSHVKALRRKLGSDLIRTVHGVGYALEPSIEPGTA
ncbi:response regulator transcription factor [Ruania alba]|uniref:DNA-binding response regulator, OmpR family, contains REC and winged-helix (WHTH) domain n=1 Tax=Ruania alba TaxID=648782 RepID=A0A1H5NFU3_9MICO|nr:response regulator transcription factor [Ruania alba]SEE99568.1 DNA-binding response regulator, OmpR family, contains REC and winged-helix (wHTH) domain [Ruania alba]